MDCAAFSSLLAELLAASRPPSDDGRIRTLRAHAAGCPDCARAMPLLELHDPVEDPGPAYWRDFERRLAIRLRSERRRFPVAGAAGVAAATIATIALILGRPGPTGPAKTPFPSETPSSEIARDAAEANDDDMAVYEGGQPIDAFAEDDRAAVFPSLDALTPAEAERLLEWLEQEEARIRKGDT